MSKTSEEIEKLKWDWQQDPCWDIEDTEGFEDHREELVAFRCEHEAAALAKHNKTLAAVHRRRMTYGFHKWRDAVLALPGDGTFAAVTVIDERLRATEIATIDGAAAVKAVADTEIRAEREA